MFCLWLFVPFLLPIVLSVLHRSTVSDCPFGICRCYAHALSLVCKCYVVDVLWYVCSFYHNVWHTVCTSFAHIHCIVSRITIIYMHLARVLTVGCLYYIHWLYYRKNTSVYSNTNVIHRKNYV